MCVKMFRQCVIVVVLVISVAYCNTQKGSCPPTLPVEICEAGCGPAIPCNKTQMCCPTVCGGSMCVDPMTQRQRVTEVKAGKCPEFPRGVWICSDACTGDSDCPRALKCCPNRCGALACQRPEADTI